jgi:hypothetical protein
MYAKCRTIEEACHLFHGMLELDSVSWDSITRYAENGYGKEILQFFQQMLQTFINPEHTTFISVFVHEGRWYFNSLSQDYNLKT